MSEAISDQRATCFHMCLNLDFSNQRQGLKAIHGCRLYEISCWQNHDLHTRQGHSKESAQSLKSAEGGRWSAERGRKPIAFPRSALPLPPSPLHAHFSSVFCVIRTRSIRWPSMSTTSRLRPSHSALSPIDGIWPSRSRIRPAIVLKPRPSHGSSVLISSSSTVSAMLTVPSSSQEPSSRWMIFCSS